MAKNPIITDVELAVVSPSSPSPPSPPPPPQSLENSSEIAKSSRYELQLGAPQSLETGKSFRELQLDELRGTTTESNVIVRMARGYVTLAAILSTIYPSFGLAYYVTGAKQFWLRMFCVAPLSISSCVLLLVMDPTDTTTKLKYRLTFMWFLVFLLPMICNIVVYTRAGYTILGPTINLIWLTALFPFLLSLRSLLSTFSTSEINAYLRQNMKESISLLSAIFYICLESWNCINESIVDGELLPELVNQCDNINIATLFLGLYLCGVLMLRLFIHPHMPLHMLDFNSVGSLNVSFRYKLYMVNCVVIAICALYLYSNLAIKGPTRTWVLLASSLGALSLLIVFLVEAFFILKGRTRKKMRKNG